MTADLLALASAANEAAIAYREAAEKECLELGKGRATHDALLAAGRLAGAVDALTGAVVEAENDRCDEEDEAAGVAASAAAVAAVQRLRGERDRLADEVVGLRETNQILLDRQATPGARRRDARRKLAARHLVEDGAVE